MTTLSDYLSAVAEKAAKATPGPWEHREGLRTLQYVMTQMGKDRIATMSTDPKEEADNAAFIASARSDIPKLLKIIEHQQETIDQHSKSLFINIPLGFRQWVDKRQRELESIANE